MVKLLNPLTWLLYKERCEQLLLLNNNIQILNISIKPRVWQLETSDSNVRFEFFFFKQATLVNSQTKSIKKKQVLTMLPVDKPCAFHRTEAHR